MGNRQTFSRKSVLITGASSGIGEALAREFVRQGASVALLARREDRLEKLVQELNAGQAGGSAPRALAIRCDVTREGDLEKAVEQVRHALGGIDVVVANAGFGVAQKVEKLGLEDYRRQFETNVYGVLRTVYATLEELKRSRGTIALMGSVAGHVALPGASAYAMSKFSVRALADALYFELKPQGVAVTLLSPGFVATEIRQVDNRGVRHAEAHDPMPTWLMASSEAAAREMVRAIARRKKEQIITFHGKVIVFFQRHLPGLIDFVRSRGLRSRSEPKALP